MHTDIKRLSWKQNATLCGIGIFLVLIVGGFSGTWMRMDDRFEQLDAKLERVLREVERR